MNSFNLKLNLFSNFLKVSGFSCLIYPVAQDDNRGIVDSLKHAHIPYRAHLPSNALSAISAHVWRTSTWKHRKLPFTVYTRAFTFTTRRLTAESVSSETTIRCL